MGLFENCSLNIEKYKGSIYICVFALLSTLKVSFLLNINQYLLALIVSVLLFCTYVTNKKMYKYDAVTISMFALFLASAIFSTRGNLNSYIGIILLIIPFFFICSLKSEYKLLLIKCLDKVLSITITFSLIAWCIYLLGFPLPHHFYSWGSYDFDDYYFFIKIQDIISYYSFPRFQYVFTEPGYFGCLCVIMIYLHEYDFKKWQTIIYVAALVLTFSLAGYILFFVGFIPFFLIKKKGKLKYALTFVVLCFLFYYLVMVNKDNVFASMFAYRLQFEDGAMVEYNRTSFDFENWWNSYYLMEGNLFFGNDTMLTNMFHDELVGVDLRVFVARYGIVALILYLWSMIYYYSRNKSRLGFFYLLIFLIFYYRGYTVMFYMGFPMLYVLGISLLKENK